MLNRHYTAVLTLAILVTLGTTSKSVASSDKVKSYSFLAGKITTLKEDSSVSNSAPTIDSEHINSYTNNSKETILAQDVDPEASDNGTSTGEDRSFPLWWLVPLIILVPLLGFLLFKLGSSSKTEQIDEEQTTSENRTGTGEVPFPTPPEVTSESAVDSNVTDNIIQEDVREDVNVEEIDDISRENIANSQVLDELQEQVENVNTTSAEAVKTQTESYEQEFRVEDNPAWEESTPRLDMRGRPAHPSRSISAESSTEAEEIIGESLTNPQSELASTDVENKEFESDSTEDLIASETIAQSQPDLSTPTEEMNAEVELEQTEQISDRDLANISEWLNEKIDSEDNKDISVMDDFWDNLSSITEEISGEIPSEEKEEISDRDLANISEWLNEKVEPHYSLSDANNILDDLSAIVEDKEQDSNEELLNNSLNLDEEKTNDPTAKEGISDSTSNFLEELLNEDSSQGSKH